MRAPLRTLAILVVLHSSLQAAPAEEVAATRYAPAGLGFSLDPPSGWRKLTSAELADAANLSRTAVQDAGFIRPDASSIHDGVVLVDYKVFDGNIIRGLAKEAKGRLQSVTVNRDSARSPFDRADIGSPSSTPFGVSYRPGKALVDVTRRAVFYEFEIDHPVRRLACLLAMVPGRRGTIALSALGPAESFDKMASTLTAVVDSVVIEEGEQLRVDDEDLIAYGAVMSSALAKLY